MEAFGPSFAEEAAEQTRELRRAATQDLKARKEKQRDSSSSDGESSGDDSQRRARSPAKKVIDKRMKAVEASNVARVAASQAQGARHAFKDIVIRRNNLSVDWQGKSILGLPMYKDIQLNLRLKQVEMDNLDAIAEGLDEDGGRAGGKGEVRARSCNSARGWAPAASSLANPRTT